jgi:hypothetical protein
MNTTEQGEQRSTSNPVTGSATAAQRLAPTPGAVTGSRVSFLDRLLGRWPRFGGHTHPSYFSSARRINL